MAPLVDYRGETDRRLRAVSVVLAVADEVAAAAELVMHKLAGRPVAIVRGYRSPLSGMRDRGAICHGAGTRFVPIRVETHGS